MGSCHSSKKLPNDSLIHHENLEYLSLIWLDNTMDKFEKKKSLQKQFRRIINYLKIFSNQFSCEEYLKQMSNDEHVIFIVNDQLGKQILPHIHHLQQVFSIYIYSSNENIDQSWINQFPKIKSICINYTELLDQLENQCKYIHDQISFDIFHPDQSNEFLYSQILIEILLEMDPMKNDMRDLISICRNQYKGNKYQLKIIREFEETYSDDNAIWWWTRNIFLSKLFSKAWKKRNLDLIFLFRFFLHDLEKQLHQYQCLTSIKVYKYQLMTKKEFELFKESIGQFISINNFLLTNTNRDLIFPSFIPNDYQSILFEITADFNHEKMKSFGNVISQKYFHNDQHEVLFMFGSIFQLNAIHPHDNHLWIIEMTLTSRTNPYLKSAFDDEINLLSFGYILQKMNQLNEAEKYFNRLFIELPDDDERIGDCCLNLGNIVYLRNDYDSSLEWLFKSLDISIRTLPSNDKFFAIIYSSMGQVYNAKNDFQSAIESYNKAMSIGKQSIDENYLNIIQCMNNIAMIYKHEKDYLLALKYFEKNLILLKQYLPYDHLDRSKIHWNIASTYKQLEQYDFALEHYNLSFEILEKYYSSDHPNIAKALGNIGIVYALKDERQTALIYYEKAEEIYRHKFPPTHINNIKINQLIQNISSPHRKISFGTIESK